MLDLFERELFARVGDFFVSRADEIAVQLRRNLSCEPFFNHLIAKSFADHVLICARESPYADFDEAYVDSAQSLDLMVLAPDKSRSILIETKLVHDGTLDSYRARRKEHGHSIAGDISKLQQIEGLPGRSRMVLIIMASLLDGETHRDWDWWLRQAPVLDVEWERIAPGDAPLVSLPGGGWVDLRAHKIENGRR